MIFGGRGAPSLRRWAVRMRLERRSLATSSLAWRATTTSTGTTPSAANGWRRSMRSWRSSSGLRGAGVLRWQQLGCRPPGGPVIELGAQPANAPGRQLAWLGYLALTHQLFEGTDAQRHVGCGMLAAEHGRCKVQGDALDRKSTRLNSSHLVISYAVFCLKKKRTIHKASLH